MKQTDEREFINLMGCKKNKIKKINKHKPTNKSTYDVFYLKINNSREKKNAKNKTEILEGT